MQVIRYCIMHLGAMQMTNGCCTIRNAKDSLAVHIITWPLLSIKDALVSSRPSAVEHISQSKETMSNTALSPAQTNDGTLFVCGYMYTMVYCGPVFKRTAVQGPSRYTNLLHDACHTVQHLAMCELGMNDRYRVACMAAHLLAV